MASHSPSAASTKVACSAHRRVLREILRPGVLLTLWERAAVPECEPVVAGLLRHPQPVAFDWRNPTEEEIAVALRRHPASEHWPEEAGEAFRREVFGLLDEFRELSGRAHPRVRLERVEDDGCALFHVDTLPLRMLCTYAGPGMQWLEEDNVRRDELGLRGRSLEEANRAIVIAAEEIRTIPAWHVAVFKGRAWEGHGYSDGLVHRSSPVRHPADFRLRLTIDTNNGCSC